MNKMIGNVSSHFSQNGVAITVNSWINKEEHVYDIFIKSTTTVSINNHWKVNGFHVTWSLLTLTSL